MCVSMFMLLSPHLLNFFELGPYYFCREKPHFHNNVKNKCYFIRGASISEAVVPSLGTGNREVCIFPPSSWAVLTLSSEGWDLLGVVGADLTEHHLPPPASQGAGTSSRQQGPPGTTVFTHTWPSLPPWSLVTSFHQAWLSDPSSSEKQ